jgi:ABC-type maltose transport system permease subunit
LNPVAWFEDPFASSRRAIVFPILSILLVTLPVLLLTVVAQREIVAGLSAGGLKDG